MVEFKHGEEELDFSPLFFKPLALSYLTEHPVSHPEEALVPYEDTIVDEEDVNDPWYQYDTSQTTRELYGYVHSFTIAHRDGIKPRGLSLLATSPMERCNPYVFMPYFCVQFPRWHHMLLTRIRTC